MRKEKLLNPNMFSRISFSGQSFIFIRCSATHCEACCSFRTPNPFKCDIRPRSEKALELIGQSEFAYQLFVVSWIPHQKLNQQDPRCALTPIYVVLFIVLLDISLPLIRSCIIHFINNFPYPYPYSVFLVYLACCVHIGIADSIEIRISENGAQGCAGLIDQLVFSMLS